MTVSEKDNDAISLAIAILEEAGFSVETVRQTKDHEDGVQARLDLIAPCDYQWFDEQAQGVREAAEEAEEVRW
jgi:hypothetical protein